MNKFLRKLLFGSQQEEQMSKSESRIALTSSKLDELEKLDEQPIIKLHEVNGGTVCVENDQIIVTNPVGIGSFATLWIPDDARVAIMINGNQTVGETFVTKEDTFEVLFDSQDAIRTFKVKVAEDKLSVSVKANVTLGRKIHLTNNSPSQRAVIQLLESPIFPDSTPIQEFLDVLLPFDFKGLIDYEAIKTLCCCTTTTEVIVVRGTAPQEATSGKYRAVNLIEDMEDEFMTGRFTTVSIGTTIAVYEPGIPGVSGVNVFGQKIPAANRDRLQVLGNGAVQVNSYVVANRSGRPVFTNEKIDVIPELVINHDIKPEDGPIVFDGSVVIRGSVLDGSSVKATGKIIVSGNVFQAVILAEEGVYIAHNVVGSQIWAGYSQVLYGELLSLVREIYAHVKLLYTEYTTVTSTSSKRNGARTNINRIPHLLLKERYSELERLMDSFTNQYSTYLLNTDNEYSFIVQVWRRNWQGIYRMNITNEHFIFLMNLFKNYQLRLETLRTGTSGTISASEVSNSVLQSSGNIVIRGKGVFSSELDSGNVINVFGNVRGGLVSALNGIFVGELGCPFETVTSVRIKGEHGIVSIKLRHPNTFIHVGRIRNKNLVLEKNVRIVDTSGKEKVSASG